MADVGRSATPSRRSHTPDENADLLPTPTDSCQKSTSRPKQLPTVTPRRFKRFFTPRSSLKRNVKIGASRQVLRDITAGDSNRRSVGRRQSFSKDAIKILEDRNEDFNGTSKKRKRGIPVSPDTTPDNSSPLKRIRGLTPPIEGSHNVDFGIGIDDGISDGGHSQDETDWDDEPDVKPIVRWREDGLAGHRLRRECAGDIGDARRRLHAVCGPEWQHATANFFSRPEGCHSCVNVTPTEPQLAIPFCTASCNSEHTAFAGRDLKWLTVVANSLVAIGDEEGGVRLLDTDGGSKTPFSQAYLSFRPHKNAILNLSFSPDDLLLATASGDQTSRVIDMPTQTAIFGMAGHTSSVKQVCFQPGSSSVVVTSSRDGSVLMWDLRCKGYDGPALKLKILLDAHEDDSSTRDRQRKVPFARPVNAIYEAHAPTIRHASSAVLKPALKTALTRDAPSRTEPQSRRGDVSITSLTFLPPGREHLLLTGSEANASVKLWDLRTTHSSRRGRAIPLSSTRQPDSHNSHRHFGLTSMALSGDGARLYTACRDNTVYTYSTSHLILGHAPELSLSTSRPRRRGSDEKEGLGPIYGFRHPQYHATTFYVKSALRPAAANHSELLAVGSSDGCAVLFPTDERYLGRNVLAKPSLPMLRSDHSRPSLSRSDSGTNLFTRLNDTIPIYQEGTALVRGHNREVTDMTWTPSGELITVGDDYIARCWREGLDARDLRMGGETEGRRWGCGWAEVEGAWDDDE